MIDSQAVEDNEICGAVPPKPKRGRTARNLLGMKFGELLVIGYAGTDRWGGARWVCKCSCGQLRVVGRGVLVGRESTSCGCLRRNGHHFGATARKTKAALQTERMP